MGLKNFYRLLPNFLLFCFFKNYICKECGATANEPGLKLRKLCLNCNNSRLLGVFHRLQEDHLKDLHGKDMMNVIKKKIKNLKTVGYVMTSGNISFVK